MSKKATTPESVIAREVDPRTYLAFRLNAGLQGKDLLPAEEGWFINTSAQKGKRTVISRKR